ncbi:MAG: hypothetical protein ACPG4T_23300, partial [Nannocystaceae bacterium]
KGAAEPAVEPPVGASMSPSAKVPPPVVESKLDHFLATQALTLDVPDGYQETNAPANPRWSYLHAVKSSTHPVEVRYGPLTSSAVETFTSRCGDDRCRKTPSDNDIKAVLKAAVAPLGTVDRVSPFPLDAVRREFNAHWGGVASFDTAPEFAGVSRGVAVVLHREGVGDGMFVALWDAHSNEIEDEWMRAFHSLTFAQPFPPPGAPELAAPLQGTIWSCSDGFVRMRFLSNTWTVITVSAAMAAMGNNVPYETAVHEIEYLPDSKFAALALRVDNMEMGDRTPSNPTKRVFTYRRDGEKLEVDRDGGKPWECQFRGKK